MWWHFAGNQTKESSFDLFFIVNILISSQPVLCFFLLCENKKIINSTTVLLLMFFFENYDVAGSKNSGLEERKV